MRLLEGRDRRQKIILNLIILLISLIGVAKRDHTIERTSSFESFLIDSLAPLQASLTSLRSEIGDFFDHYLTNIEASKKNRQYRKNIKELETQLSKLEELTRENRRLKKLLRFGEEVSFKKVLAQVVAWDANSDFNVIRINAGVLDGVRLQAPVVTSDGLVGYIYRLTDHFADILTILDSNNRVDGLVQRVRAHGILEGLSSERITMKYISRAEPLILGDTVMTSGLGNIYPKGIKVGVVSRIERESYGITQDVELVPAVDFGHLEEVIILISDENEQKAREWQALDDMDDATLERRKK